MARRGWESSRPSVVACRSSSAARDSAAGSSSRARWRMASAIAWVARALRTGSRGTPKMPSARDGRAFELLLGRQFLAAQHHVVGELGQVGGDLLARTDPRLVGLDRVAGDDEVLRPAREGPAAPRRSSRGAAGRVTSGLRPAFRSSSSGHSWPSTNAASCMTPIFSGLAIFLSVAMSARGTS